MAMTFWRPGCPAGLLRPLVRRLAAGLGGLLLLPGLVQAAGFGIFTQGAAGLGQANAVTAHTDGPSSIFFNPALLSDLPGTQLELGTTLINAPRSFSSAATGSHDSTENHWYAPSTFYFSDQAGEGLHLGVGLFSPFGLGTDWKDDWEGRYLATSSEITTLTLNPVAAVRVSPGLTLAAGLNLLYLDASLNRKLKLTGINPAFPDGQQTFSGEGTGTGFNLGLSLALSERLRFGLAYRSRIRVDIDGEVEFQLPNPALNAIFPEGDAATDLTLPSQAVAGLAYRLGERLTVEAGLRWEEWSSYRELALEVEQPVAGQTRFVTRKDWRDTYAWNLGLAGQLTPAWSLLAGYLYGQSAVPDATFEPSVPDADSHLFCLGTVLQQDRWRLALSYGYQLLESRRKANQVGSDVLPPDAVDRADGRYRSQLHLVGISAGYRF